MPSANRIGRPLSLVLTTVLSLAWIGYGSMWIFGSGSFTWSSTLFGLGCWAMGVWLFLRRFWARRITAAVLVVFGILVPIGYLNPFRVMDSGEQLSPAQVYLQIVAALAVALGCIALAYFLDPPTRLPPTGDDDQREGRAR